MQFITMFVLMKNAGGCSVKNVFKSTTKTRRNNISRLTGNVMYADKLAIVIIARSIERS